jgi:hypothetical protein
MTDSAMALSKLSPTVQMDGAAPTSRSARCNALACIAQV